MVVIKERKNKNGNNEHKSYITFSSINHEKGYNEMQELLSYGVDVANTLSEEGYLAKILSEVKSQIKK